MEERSEGEHAEGHVEEQASRSEEPTREPSQPQPPAPAAGTGLDPKVAALLSYLVGWITGVIFYVIEKDKYVRFHALQSIFFSVAVIVAYIALSIVSVALSVVPVIGAVIGTLLWLAVWGGSLVLWIVLMLKAYQGERYKLPVIGDWAEANA